MHGARRGARSVNCCFEGGKRKHGGAFMGGGYCRPHGCREVTGCLPNHVAEGLARSPLQCRHFVWRGGPQERGEGLSR